MSARIEDGSDELLKAERMSGHRIEVPRRYIVRSASGAIRVVNVDTPDRARVATSDVIALMGTHETQAEAVRRLGWSA